jgi:protein involved in polysaccharide export with SLBB domain
MGNFLRTREDGLNPGYVITTGDHVAVNTWGAVAINEVYVVDSQGNVFLPEVGPIRLAGVRNAELTQAVKTGLSRVYSRYFDVYTNLITAKPVAVFVTGGVNRPGRYAGVPSDSVLFFLDQAAGIDPQLGSYRNLSILRAGKSIAEIDLYDFILDGKLDTPQFKDGDTILVRKRGATATLTGAVAMPAVIELKSAPAKGSDALRVVSGAPTATEVTVSGIRSGVPISRTLTRTSFEHFQIQDGDVITLRADGRADTILVKIEGEYLGPSVLSVRRGSRLVDVLNHIPVSPLLADTSAVHLKRTSVAKAQKDAIEDSLFRLERSALLAVSSSRGESEIRVKEAALTQQFVERARLIQPLGRVVTVQEGRQSNVLLEAGDVIVVPPKSNVVRVAGEVWMSQAVIFSANLSAEDYIEAAGGYTDRAEEDRVIVIHPDASVTIGDSGTKILPGDEVLVPPRIDTKEVQNILDVTQIIYQIAISAAVVLAL